MRGVKGLVLLFLILAALWKNKYSCHLTNSLDKFSKKKKKKRHTALAVRALCEMRDRNPQT